MKYQDNILMKVIRFLIFIGISVLSYYVYLDVGIWWCIIVFITWIVCINYFLTYLYEIYVSYKLKKMIGNEEKNGKRK